MGQQGGSNALKWVIGCSVGCLILCVICAIILIGGGYFLVGKAGKQAGVALAAEYDQMKHDNKVPADHIALFDEIVAATQKENASMWAVTISMMAVTGILQDGQVTEDEAKQAQTIRDFVVENPDCSMMEMASFFESHPELGDMQRKMQQSGMGMGAVPTPPSETPAETSAEPPAEEAK